MKRVTAAVIIEDGRLLIARRPPGDPLEGMWELPGGKIEDGETPQECLERELLEELAMGARVGEMVASTTYDYDHGSFEMLALCAVRISDYRLLAHDRVAWVHRDEIASHPLAPADIELIAELIETGIL